MRPDLSKLGIRHQLLGLFGLFLFTGALVLALDEVGQHRTQQSLERMRDDVLAGMRGIRGLSDVYGQDVVNTTFRARNHLISWEQGLAEVDRAQAQARAGWQALERAGLGGEDHALLQQALQARPRADAAVMRLREALQARDVRALGRFADAELYPAMTPLVVRLKRIADHAHRRADAVVEADIARGEWLSRLRMVLSLACLAVVVLLGRRILRNGYRGVESLTDLSRRMAQHDYAAEPHYRPTGELGEVLDSFLRMRAHVQRIETQLTDQLMHNDRVRVALERREHFQRLLLEAAQVAIFAVDDDGGFSQVNPFAEQMLGWPVGSLVGRERMDAILDPEAVQALAHHLGEAYAQPIAADWTALRALAQHREPPREFVLRHRRGRAMPVLLALSAMRDDTGAMVGLLAVATDLTAIKRLERALRDSESRAREASLAKSAFLAAMSHEIRTPMIGVTGMIEVLDHTPLDAEQRRALNVIQASADALLRIIGDILDFSKIEAGRLELDPAATALPDLVRSISASYAGSASSRGLALHCEVDPRVGPAHYADPLRLRQILGNFLSNAIKFTEQGGVEVALELRRADGGAGSLGTDELVFRVSDTGIGISEQAQARLFQPFSQAEADTTRRFGGTGLGLAISRRLAELMGGELEMESVPGVGTTMRLRVRLARAPVAELPAAAGPGRATPGYSPRALPAPAEAERERSLVLLVDDHPTNRQVIQRQLALAGYASETAEDGVDGLERWRSGRYALVLSDVHMPRMDGYLLAAAIREEEARRRLARTPVVALTASALKGEAERCLTAGMDDYLAKPVSIATLGACLQRWLPHTAGASQSPGEAAARESDNHARAVAAEAGLPQLADPPTLASDVLDELTGGNADEARALLADFLASTVDDIQRMQALRAAGDLPGLTRQAHKIRGAARIVGAHQLAEAAGRLEAAGRAADWADLLPLEADVATAAERLRLDVAARYPA